jgi:phosphoglycolate phosphatase-like HAD superfamily hydrolase
MNAKYMKLFFSDNGPTYILKDHLKEIKKIDVIIFDCDGVLLDVRKSYKNAVSRTTSIIIEAFTGYKIPEKFFDERLYIAYKNTGGFNNDWTHTYAYIMKILSELPHNILIEINHNAKSSLQISDITQRLEYIKENQQKISLKIKPLYVALLNFASSLDSNGLESVDRQLLPILGVNVKKALNYKAPVGESIISTIFEEVFGGINLFEETFGIKAQFNQNKKGYVENQKIIINHETLKKLKRIINNRIGIASSSLSNTAHYALGEIINNFPKKSMIWYEDVEKVIKETGRINLHKPDSYSLLKASETFEPYNVVLYVGDTIADQLMVSNTKKTDNRFLFAGVYGFASLPEQVMVHFLSEECIIVTPSINELPLILETFKGQ